MTKGIVFNLQKFSIHDGPGIRTTIFFKGCPLRCAWCSNPESQLSSIQILYDKTKCTRCQACLKACPHHAIVLTDDIVIQQNKCQQCLSCVQACHYNALTHAGEYKSIDDIVQICLQDLDFYQQSHGGVTISGGEAMSQPMFLKELAIALSNHHIHLAIETTGMVPENYFQDLAPYFDLLLFDIKHYDDQHHYDGTHAHQTLILKNLRWALQHHIDILCRIPVIPHFNNSLEDALGFVTLLQSLNINKVQLLPFHQFGERKYELLNRQYQYKNVKALYKEDLKNYQQIFLDHNIHCFF